jgi:hypothetical protein
MSRALGVGSMRQMAAAGFLASFEATGITVSAILRRFEPLPPILDLAAKKLQPPTHQRCAEHTKKRTAMVNLPRSPTVQYFALKHLS